eukprot:15250117-Alexandrium_andersonii.AAC.1
MLVALGIHAQSDRRHHVTLLRGHHCWSDAGLAAPHCGGHGAQFSGLGMRGGGVTTTRDLLVVL